MTSPNPHQVETLAKLQDALMNRDIATVLTTLAPNVLWNIAGPAEIPYAGVFYGTDGYSRFFWLLGETISFHDAKAHTTLWGDNMAVCMGGESGHAKSTGKPYHYDWVIEYIFDANNQIVRMHQFFDPTPICAALRANP